MNLDSIDNYIDDIKSILGDDEDDDDATSIKKILRSIYHEAEEMDDEIDRLKDTIDELQTDEDMEDAETVNTMSGTLSYSCSNLNDRMVMDAFSELMGKYSPFELERKLKGL